MNNLYRKACLTSVLANSPAGNKMAEKIKTYLNDDSDYFIIVDAGHIIGDKGIIAILKNAGFIVD